MSIFSKLFKKPDKIYTRAELLDNVVAPFTAWSGDAYSNDIYREGVDAIARNVGKLKGSHVVKYNGVKKNNTDFRLDRILQVQPNEYMTAYDMLYKLTTHYYLYNNAFAYINKDDKGNVLSIYPINCTQADFITDSSDKLYCQFNFRNGKSVILPYSNIIHLRRNFNSNELLGDNNSALLPALEVAHTQNEGIVNGIKSSATIRGILKYTQLLADDKLKELKDNFVKDYLSLNNEGGVVAVDSKTEYQPIDLKPVTIDSEQLKATQDKIYNYLGITEKVVNSSYDENEYGAFYESVIEPIALQLSLEFTRKLFNERELAYGNSVVFDSGRLIFSSNKTKLELISGLAPYGALTINQALEILNLPPVEDGDRRLQSLNYANTEIVDKYQQGKAGNKTEEKPSEADNKEIEEPKSL